MNKEGGAAGLSTTGRPTGKSTSKRTSKVKGRVTGHPKSKAGQMVDPMLAIS